MHKLLILLLLPIAAFSQQNISVSYPCTVSVTHDTFTISTKTVVDYYEYKKDTGWCSKCNMWCWLFGSSPKVYPCKFWTDSIPIYKNVTDTLHFSTTHDSAETCYRDSIVFTQVNFGALINGTYSPESKAALIKDSLHCDYVRDAINLPTFSNNSKTVNAELAKGLKLVLNLNYQTTTGAANFITGDLTAFQNQIAYTYSQIPIDLAVLGNEPNNPTFNTGNISDYCNMLKAASIIVHQRQGKITDGGIYGYQLAVIAWRYFDSTHQYAARDSIGLCLTPLQLKGAENPGSSATLETDVQNRLAIINTDKNWCDYVNLHLYEDTTKPLQDIPHLKIFATYLQKYIKQYTGLEAITNETCQRNNTDPNIVAAMVQIYKDLHFPYAIWFSGDSSMAGAMSLVNTDGTLRNNGKEFAKDVK